MSVVKKLTLNPKTVGCCLFIVDDGWWPVRLLMMTT
jgi:hypothetical protein